MSLQEAKDQGAKSWGLKDFNEFKSQNRPPDNLIAFMESVAEQYARSKWDEACKSQRIECSRCLEVDVPKSPTHNLVLYATKPEFKP